MTRRLAALAVVAMMGTGCAYLQIDTNEKLWGVTLAPKIVGRILWAAPSLGTSELVYACARRRGGGPRNFDICSYGDGRAYRDSGYSASYSQAPPAAPRRNLDQDLANDGNRQTEAAQQQPKLPGNGETQPHYPAAMPD
jgi:hypothetical protein